MQPLVILSGLSRALIHLLQPKICNDFLGQLQKNGGRGRKKGKEEERKEAEKEGGNHTAGIDAIHTQQQKAECYEQRGVLAHN